MKFTPAVDGVRTFLHDHPMRWFLIIACFLPGCAGGSSQASLGPVGLYRVAADGVSLERLRSIELPNRADIIVRPHWFSGTLRSAEGSSDDVRIQTQVRLTRADGVEQRFFMTGDNSDKSGHTERVAKPNESGRYTHSMAGRRYGPIDAFESVALEFLVAQVEPGSGGGDDAIGGPIGVMALRQSPPLDCLEPGVLKLAEAQLKPYGAILELAARVPVKANVPTSDRVYEEHFLVVEVDPAGNTEDALDRVERLLKDSAPGASRLGDSGGRPIEGLSVLSLVLQVGEHVPKAPRKEKRRKPEDERLKSPQKISFVPQTGSKQ